MLPVVVLCLSKRRVSDDVNLNDVGVASSVCVLLPTSFIPTLRGRGARDEGQVPDRTTTEGIRAIVTVCVHTRCIEEEESRMRLGEKGSCVGLIRVMMSMSVV